MIDTVVVLTINDTNKRLVVKRRSRLNLALLLGALLGRRVSINFDRRIKAEGMWHLSGCVIAFGPHTAIGIEELSAPSSVGASALK